MNKQMTNADCPRLTRKGPLRPLAYTALLSTIAVLNCPEAKATPVDWVEMSQTVPWYSEDDNVRYTTTLTLNGNAPSHKMTLLFYKYFPSHGGYYYATGGVDIAGGSTQADGWFLVNTGYGDGMDPGENLSTDNAPPGFWDVLYDDDGDGIYGLVDDPTGIPIAYWAGHHLNGYTGFSIQVSNLPAFPPDDTPQFGGTIAVIVPSLPCPMPIQTFTANTSDQTNVCQITATAPYEFITTCHLQYRDSLTNADWSNLQQYSVTGTVTVVADTNTVPQRFYRVMSP